MRLISIAGILGLAALIPGGCSCERHDERDKPYMVAKPSHRQSETSIALETRDHWKISGDLFLPAENPIGVVIMLHQRGGTRSDWAQLPEVLSAHGIASLAIDQRGAGLSTGPDSNLNGNNAPWDTSEDIAAAVDYIQQRFGSVGPKGTKEYGHIGLIGASYGANNAIIFAAEHRDEIKAVSLLSPGSKYHDELDAVAAAKNWTGPLAIYYARNDSIAGLGPQEIRDACPSHSITINPFDDDNHGTALLSCKPDPIGTNVTFFETSLN